MLVAENDVVGAPSNEQVHWGVIFALHARS
jgi:hypothetical protein